MSNESNSQTQNKPAQPIKLKHLAMASADPDKSRDFLSTYWAGQSPVWLPVVMPMAIT